MDEPKRIRENPYRSPATEKGSDQSGAESLDENTRKATGPLQLVLHMAITVFFAPIAGGVMLSFVLDTKSSTLLARFLVSLITGTLLAIVTCPLTISALERQLAS